MNHTELVQNLKKPGNAIMASLSPEQCDQLHMIVGICTEAGELLDAFKKHVFYEKPLDMENVVEELGDIEFYMEGLRQTLGLNRDAILAHNIAKLSKRYEKGTYTNESAITRADKLES